MNIEQKAEEFSQMHIDHPRLFGQIASLLTGSGETGVLLWLAQQKKECFAVDIIDHFGLTPGRVANILRKLEERGYLIRRQDTMDQRRSSLQLTEEGRVHAGLVDRKVKEQHLQLFRGLGEDDSADILRILKKMISMSEP